jgi:integrase
MENITLVSIMLDNRYSRKTDNRHPLKMRIIHGQDRKYYPLSKWYTTSESSYMGFFPPKAKKQKIEDSDVQSPEPKEAIKKENTKPVKPISEKQLKNDKVWLIAKLNDANKIISKEPNISIKDFEAKMFNNEGTSDAYDEMQAIANNLRNEGRIKYAISFESAITSIKKETGKNKLPFNSVDVSFLKAYDKKMIDSGNSTTAIGFYLRNLRVAYNRAILNKIIDRDYYPFGKASDGKYEIPTGKNVKKALTKDDIGKLMNFALHQDSPIAKGRDFWIFSYLCNGMNIKDMASLKYENIGTNTITFIRSKTARSTRKNPKTIVVPYTNEIKEIIMHWGNNSKNSKDYVFPILKKGLSQEEIVVKVASAVDFINNNIKAVAKLAGVNKNITTYTARHSWATVLKRAGVSTDYISEGLGHSDMATTENYLDSFESDDLFKNAALLTDF